MSVRRSRDKHAPADAHTPPNCSLLRPAADVGRPGCPDTSRVRPVRFACACTVLLLREETMAQELEPLHSFMPGGRTAGTHIVIRTHSVTSSQLPSLCFFLHGLVTLSLSLPSWHRLRLPLKEVIPRRTPLQVTRILLLRRF